MFAHDSGNGLGVLKLIVYDALPSVSFFNAQRFMRPMRRTKARIFCGVDYEEMHPFCTFRFCGIDEFGLQRRRLY